jgi:hypothetical protein
MDQWIRRIKNICIYTLNIGVAKYITINKPKGEIENNAIIVEDFKTPVSTIKRSCKQKLK